MKTFAVLFVLSLAVGLLVNWRDPLSSAPPVPHAAHQPESSSPATPGVRPQPDKPLQNAALRRLPPSFAGTQVDGRLAADSTGQLIVDDGIRRVFDYFLASIGEEPIATSVARLRHYIEAELPQPAETQALRLLTQYLDYKQQLLALEQNHAQGGGLDAMRERLAAVRQLRATIFADQVHRAFFATDEALDTFTLQRLAISRDASLDAASKGAALDSLKNGLPDALRDLVSVQLQQELRTRSRQLDANGGTPDDLRALRQQLVGNDATARLEQLDRARQDWRRRVAEYRQERTRIETSRGLSETDKQAAISRLAMDRFDERERKRLDAAQRLLAAQGN